MQRQVGRQLHERQVAELLFVSGYGPLALLHHGLDRLDDTWVCLANFVDLHHTISPVPPMRGKGYDVP
jgi:hypothetical protein